MYFEGILGGVPTFVAWIIVIYLVTDMLVLCWIFGAVSIITAGSKRGLQMPWYVWGKLPKRERFMCIYSLPILSIMTILMVVLILLFLCLPKGRARRKASPSSC